MSFDGIYSITVHTPMGDQQGKLTIKTEGNTFSGNLETDMGASDLSDCVISGNELQWRAESKTPMGPIDVSFKAVIDGDAITGEAVTPFGSAPMEGKKV